MNKIAFDNGEVYFTIDFGERTNDIIELMKKKVDIIINGTVNGEKFEIRTKYLHFIH